MKNISSLELGKSWHLQLQGEFKKDYMLSLNQFLFEQQQSGKAIFPPRDQLFSAFSLTPFNKVKVVILGQDPYHGPNQAHGLCFSVLPGIKLPPSLRNIYKEIQQDLGFSPPNHGYLTHWAEQGVLMLNSVLTVEQGKAAAHQGKGWEIFTDAVIHLLNNKLENLVFILWGAYAQKKGHFIEEEKHLVLSSAHPSPFSADRGFFGCRHFSKANQYLLMHSKEAIDWQLPDIAEY